MIGKAERACQGWRGPQRWLPGLLWGPEKWQTNQIYTNGGTICFLTPFQCLILGEDTAGKRCRDSKGEGTLTGEVAWQKTSVKVGPSGLSSVACQNNSKSERKIGMAENQYGYLKCPHGVWSLKWPGLAAYLGTIQKINSSLRSLLHKPRKPQVNISSLDLTRLSPLHF